ncbi:MAG: polyprenyl synthetase family protein [Treponema sp.]|nr:polyprenyl synthetase family protein [Treponema sp.]
MNNNFKVILNNIEKSLEKALPAEADSKWIKDSFGKLPPVMQGSHFENLISPNKNLIELGGKRWRPLLMVLCYQMAKKQTAKELLSEEEIYSLTPLVEFVHTASLIHDDIEDGADLRRGKPAAHITYGTDTAINAASWLYFEAPVCINNCKISAEEKLIFYQTYTQELRRLHLGQAMDIHWHRNPSIFPTEDEYLAMVKNKTGRLASLAAKTGGIAGGLSESAAEELGNTAANIGMGFQIIDDVINLTTGNKGKKRGDDIVEGKKSLPVIMHVCDHPEDKNEISLCMSQAAAEGPDSPAVEKCISILEKYGCIEKAAQKGIALIKENSAILDSADIKELFISLVPPEFIKD